MTTRKRIQKSTSELSKQDPITPKGNSPLIFISHDTRDAELADEFSNLLRSASAGALKSFVSSDKKGTRGIEYGLEWYPAIMDKIDEASEVVCLLTKRSVERPWILYEAGVAKGKLGKKVIGIALGIPNNIAFTGPFAQFQNNDGSVNSVSKLVMELVRKVPGLDPDLQLVEQLVQTFQTKATEILKSKVEHVTEIDGNDNENMVVKLFEEVKLMFENLPDKIENKFEPQFRKRPRKYYPMMFDEVLELGNQSKDQRLGFLILISLLKDDLPWLYEIGLETYRGLRTAKTALERRKLIGLFSNSFDMLERPSMRELFGKSDEIFVLRKMVKHYMRHFMDETLNEEQSKE